MGSGSSSGGAGGSSSGGGGASSGSSSGVADAQATGGFAIGGVLSDANGGGALAGVSRCLIAAPSTCTTTDSGGNFLLDGLAGTGDGFIASLSGYVTGVWPVTPTGQRHGLVDPPPVDHEAHRPRAVGGDQLFDSSTGALVFAAVDTNGNGVAGVSVSVSAGGTIAYFNANGSALDSTLTTTAAWGGGYAFGVPAGTAGVTFSAPGKVCVRKSPEGWTGTSGQTTAVPVTAGRLTRAAAVCQ